MIEREEIYERAVHVYYLLNSIDRQTSLEEILWEFAQTRPGSILAQVGAKTGVEFFRYTYGARM